MNRGSEKNNLRVPMGTRARVQTDPNRAVVATIWYLDEEEFSPD